MHSFRIGRLFGIEVRVDRSWLLIFLLMTWNLVMVFAAWHPAWSPLGHLLVAMIASLLFFGCVVVHELAHSLVARRYGMDVRSITLFLFGGVSNIEREPSSPGAEFVTAIVGPITSLVLGVVLILLGSLMAPSYMVVGEDSVRVLRRVGPLTTLFLWLGPINILIGLFNLIPGFPLDGGRVLRSILWKIGGDVRRATRQASSVGQAVGILFIVIGVAMAFGITVPFFGTGLIGGLWLAFIGWFLYGAAGAYTARLDVDEALSGRMVIDLMRTSGVMVTPEVPISVLVSEYLVRTDERAIPVVRGDELVGIVSIADVRKVPPEEWVSTPVSAVMSPSAALATATPEESLSKAFERMALADLDQLPVVANGRLVGMLQRRDVARWLEIAWRPMAGAGRGERPSMPHGPPHPRGT